MNSVLDPETAAQHLGAFPQIARQRLVDVLFDERFDGTIRCEVVEDVRHLGSMTIERFMLAILPVVRLYATPATSAFAVGAVCKGASGNAYFGANLELTGAPLGFTIHAEQSAIANALAHREKAVRHLAVTAPPCGHCRQFLKELTGSSTLEITTATRATMTLASLLPDSFGPGDLGVKEGLLGHAATPLTSACADRDPLLEAALCAASCSYAPYTHACSGVAFRLKNGAVVAGSYIENAAFNPSVPPVVAAIDRLRFRTRTYSDVAEAVLVELEGAKVSQEAITRPLLDVVAPGAPLRLVKATPC